MKIADNGQRKQEHDWLLRSLTFPEFSLMRPKPLEGFNQPQRRTKQYGVVVDLNLCYLDSLLLVVLSNLIPV